MSADDAPASLDEVAAALNAICSAAVGAGRSDDIEAIALFTSRLSARAERFREQDHDEVADFLTALAGLLRGQPLAAALAGLEEPYRQGLRAVAADIEAPAVQLRPDSDAPADRMPAAEPKQAAPRSEAPNGPAAAAAAPEGDWVAALAAHVAALLKARDRETARGLADELEKTARRPGVDPDAAAYLEVLLGVLRGQDVRPRVLRLAEPYRSAYGSLQAVMRGADPRAALLERVVHNVRLVRQSGSAEARSALAAVLQDLRREAERTGEAELGRFVEGIRSWVETQGDAAGGPTPVEAPALQSADLIAAWQELSR